MIVFDSPPLLTVTDAALLSQQVVGTQPMADMGTTVRPASVVAAWASVGWQAASQPAHGSQVERVSTASLVTSEHERAIVVGASRCRREQVSN